jgi:presenilin-like A22 family membrane protease
MTDPDETNRSNEGNLAIMIIAAVLFILVFAAVNTQWILHAITVALS